MRTVIEVNFYNSKKAKVKLDDGFTFALYRGELRKYHISSGATISDDNIKTIVEDILNKRAKERALHMLKDSSKTKKQVIDKLKQSYYPDCTIEYVIRFLEKYNYIDDENYTRFYIENYKSSRSIQKMKLELYKKGINQSIINSIFEDTDINQQDALDNLLAKKMGRYNINNEKDKVRLYNLILRNGFSYEEASRALRERQ